MRILVRRVMVLSTMLPMALCPGVPALADDGPTPRELGDAATSTEWLLPNHSYASQRHVNLTQIDREHASQLRPVCTYAFDDTNRFGSGPLVYGGVMYVTSGDTTVALDAATCDVHWRHVWQGRDVPGVGNARKAVGNAFKSRGAALGDGKLVRATSDSRLIALDTATGRLLWDRPVATAGRYEFVMMAPLIHDGLVIAGIGIGEFAVKGWIGAFRLSDGEPVWRFNTVPDDGEPGVETWSDADARQHGGGGVWVTPSIDAATGLLYAAVGNPVPDFFGDVREGSNLYTGSLIVLDAKSGRLVWHRQLVPHDLHDWDLTVAGPLYEVATADGARPMIAVGGKDGLLRSIDRETRQQRFEAPVTTRLDADVVPTVQGVHACPGVLGGMQWSLPAFNPGLGLLFAPAVDWCGTYRKTDELRYVQGQLYLGGSFSFDPLDKSRGVLTAVDAVTGELRWKYESARPMLAAVTTTSAGLVFTGELTGHLLVLDGRDGKVLFRFDTGMPLHAGVITYAVAGKQYIAVASGAAVSFWRVPSASSAVMVFALP